MPRAFWLVSCVLWFGCSTTISPTADVALADSDAGLEDATQDTADGARRLAFTRGTDDLQGALTTGDARHGAAISIASDGSIVAIGQPGDVTCRPGVYAAADLSTSVGSSCDGSGAVEVRRAAGGGPVWFIKASEVVSDTHFGSTVAVSSDGTIIAVGAPGDGACANCAGGGVFVFERSGDTWIERQVLVPSLPASGDEFGASLDISSDGLRIVVGAPGESGCAAATVDYVDGQDQSCEQSGAAFVYLRTGTGDWTLRQSIKPTTVEAGDRFGMSVSVGDGTDPQIAVGSLDDSCSTDPANNSCEQAGAVYTFRLQTPTVQMGFIKAIVADAGDHFGHTVDISPSYEQLLIGAPFEDSCEYQDPTNNLCEDSGAVYLFAQEGADVSVLYIKPAEPLFHERFGFAIAADATSNYIAVGAPSGNCGSSAECNPAGAVYLVERVQGQWRPTLRFPGGAQAESHYGHSLSLSSVAPRLLAIGIPGRQLCDGVCYGDVGATVLRIEYLDQ